MRLQPSNVCFVVNIRVRYRQSDVFFSECLILSKILHKIQNISSTRISYIHTSILDTDSRVASILGYDADGHLHGVSRNQRSFVQFHNDHRDWFQIKKDSLPTLPKNDATKGGYVGVANDHLQTSLPPHVNMQLELDGHKWGGRSYLFFIGHLQSYLYSVFSYMSFCIHICILTELSVLQSFSVQRIVSTWNYDYMHCNDISSPVFMELR